MKIKCKSMDWDDEENDCFVGRGLFNVPHVTHCYLINGTLLKSFTPEFIDSKTDPDLKICQSLRDSVREERMIER